MPNTTVRLAHPGDERKIEEFLARHADGSLFLRSFLARGGIIDEGKPLQGTYAIALDDGHVSSVAMHNRQDGVFLQAPEHAAEVTSTVLEKTGRPLVALLGPWQQVDAVCIDLGKVVQKQSRDGLFALNLSDLIYPAWVELETVSYRRAESRDLDLLREWRFRFDLECSGMPDTDATRSFAASLIEGHVERGEAFLLERGGTPVSLCTHNARASDAVQIGSVWTPPDLRGRGYARRIVAEALREAQQTGVSRAVLFTENKAAQRAYEALGFERVGEYSIILFAR